MKTLPTLALFATIALAQTTALLPVPKIRFFTTAGAPCNACKVYTYQAGTTTPLATYTSSTGGTPNANPVILDSSGHANIWLANQAYKIELRTAADVVIWTTDQVYDWGQLLKRDLADPAGSNGASLVAYRPPNALPDTNVKDQLDELLSPNVRNACAFAGANAGEKITAAIADLPGTGGVVDARCLDGAQTLGALTISAPKVQIMFGVGTYGTTGITITAPNVRITGIKPDSTVFNITSGGTFGIKIVDAMDPTIDWDAKLFMSHFSVTTSVTGIAVKGIFFDNTYGATLDDIIVNLTNNNAANTLAFHGVNFHDNTVTNCHFNSGSGTNAHGVKLQYSTAPIAFESHGNLWLKCRFQNSGGWGFVNAGTHNNRFISSHFQNNGLGGRWEADDGSGNGTIASAGFGNWYEFNDSGDSLRIDVAETLVEIGSIFPDSDVTNYINISNLCQSCVISGNFGFNNKPLVIGANTQGSVFQNNRGFTVPSRPTEEALLENGSISDTLISSSARFFRLNKATAGVAGDFVRLGFLMPDGTATPVLRFLGGIGSVLDSAGSGAACGGIGFWTGSEAGTGLRGEVTCNGRFGIGVTGSSVAATLHAFSTSASIPAVIIQRAGGQTANLTSWRTEGGSDLAWMDDAANFYPRQLTFGGLPAIANGAVVYCSDCTIANPCAGAGTGAIAKRLNGAWVCN